MSLPYYKRFPRDFLEGTIGLSFEVKGAYAIVLDLIYMRDGRLADDARYIAGQLGCSVRKWTAIRQELIEGGKLTVKDGIISNFRADYLTEESRKYQDKQAEIAGKPRKNNDLRQPKPSQPETEPKKETEANASAKNVETKAKGTRLPDDWTPQFAEIAFAKQEGMTLEEITLETDKFRDFWHAKPGAGGRKSDWPATWRNWCRNRRSGPRVAGGPRSGGYGQGPSDFASIIAEHRGRAGV